MSSSHVVRLAADAEFAAPREWAKGATAYSRWNAVAESDGAVHTGFGVCDLEPGGSVPTHVHSFEESVYVVDGVGRLDTSEGSFRLAPGDYALIPVGVPHRWRNDSSDRVRWAEMQGPAPRDGHDGDTLLVPELPDRDDLLDVDVRDPRTRRFGHIEPVHMEPGRQDQASLAVSASMRTALLVYSGITVKMMVDSDLGADLTTMFMVQYEPAGVAGPHDHPFEETYYFLEGRAEATFDDERYELGPGDIAWAGVGCVHSFRNLGGGPLRWLETQSPQPPGRHSYRFARDWDYLRGVLP
ncbi:MAG TPA: cupin domain-containing protein [Nocardioidaceae bacterium]|nr:cupin domain-containing protein [Nocardioidaceae bacterium]